MTTKASDTKNFTRGGQITLHNIRMFLQIMDKVSWLVGGVFLLLFMMTSFLSTTNYQRYVYGQYLWANILPLIDATLTTHFIQPNGQESIVHYQDIVSSSMVKHVVYDINRILLRSFIIALAGAMVSFICLSKWLKNRGESHITDTPIKGDEMISKQDAKKLIEKQGIASDLLLAQLPLIKNKETAHFFFHGTTGTGKSNAIKELLDQIRKRGDRAIIYDKSCNYLEEFYQPKKDILLNPLDDRGETWHLWLECRDSADYDSLAAAQIPMPLSTQDPFWVNAARTIFSTAAFEMRNDPERSMTKLLRYLLTADLDRIQKYLKGTEAEILVSEKIEKTAISIKSVLATYLKSLKYIKDENNPFSIRQWIQNDEANNWLFITSLGDRHETLKPLITAWLDIAVNTLLSLSPNENRRIWLILDELTSLHQLPYLTQTLSESRKFGGCIVIGIQNYAQLCKVYGHDGAKEISSLLNTRLMFRQPDPEMARWSAQNFGESIIDEVRENISYGANTIRDGISINRVEARKPLISFSEIMSLADLFAYIRLPGQLPITLIEFSYKKRPRRNMGFIARKNFDENSMKKISALIDKYEKQNFNQNKPVGKKLPEEKENKNQPETNTTHEFEFDV